MNDLVEFLHARRGLPEVRINASAVLEELGETSPEALVGRTIPVPSESGLLEYRISEYLFQQDCFIVKPLPSPTLPDRPTLVEFLNARLDEDEQMALAAAENLGGARRWELRGDTEVVVPLQAVPDPNDPGVFTVVRAGYDDGRPVVSHIARHDPARVLADVEADRKLIAEFKRCGPQTQGHIGLLGAVKIRAERFADHPDYDESWRP